MIVLLVLSVLVFAMPGHGAPGVMDVRLNSANHSSFSLSTPDTTQAGNFLLAHIVVRGGSDTVVTSPAGWIIPTGARVDQGTQIASIIMYRNATADDEGGKSYTWTTAGNVQFAGAILAFQGIDAYPDPIDNMSSAIGTGTVIHAPGLNTTGAPTLLLGLYAKADARPVFAVPNETYQHSSAGGNAGSRVAGSTERFDATGTTGDRNVTASGMDAADPHIGRLIALRTTSAINMTASPANATVGAGSDQAFYAHGNDTYGNPFNLTTFAAWTMDNGTCTVNVCTSQNVGNHTVTATYGALNATSILNVFAGPMVNVTIPGGNITVYTNALAPFQVPFAGVDAYGNTFSINASWVNFTVSDLGAGSFDNDTFTPKNKVGSYQIQVYLINDTNRFHNVTLKILPPAAGGGGGGGGGSGGAVGAGLPPGLTLAQTPQGALLTWNSLGPNHAYQIWRSNSPWVNVGETAKGETSFLDAGTVTGARYMVTSFTGPALWQGYITDPALLTQVPGWATSSPATYAPVEAPADPAPAPPGVEPAPAPPVQQAPPAAAPMPPVQPTLAPILGPFATLALIVIGAMIAALAVTGATRARVVRHRRAEQEFLDEIAASTALAIEPDGPEIDRLLAEYGPIRQVDPFRPSKTLDIATEPRHVAGLFATLKDDGHHRVEMLEDIAYGPATFSNEMDEEVMHSLVVADLFAHLEEDVASLRAQSGSVQQEDLGWRDKVRQRRIERRVGHLREDLDATEMLARSTTPDDRKAAVRQAIQLGGDVALLRAKAAPAAAEESMLEFEEFPAEPEGPRFRSP